MGKMFKLIHPYFAIIIHGTISMKQLNIVTIIDDVTYLSMSSLV